MGRTPCCDKTKVKKGPWSSEEDALLMNFITKHGNGGNWISLPKKAGLNRCGKSCRLRYFNYLRPDIKHGDFTEEEDYVIYTLYNTIGSRWAIIASNLQGRTDNDVKNYWNTKLKKKLSLGKSKDNKNPININTTNNDYYYGILSDINTHYSTLSWQTLRNNNEEIIKGSNLSTSNTNYQFDTFNNGEGNEINTQGYSSNNSSSATQDISGYSSSSTTSSSNSNRKSSGLIALRGENDEFWMDLFADSFDDVVLVGSQLEEKISEIASLLIT